MGGSPGSRPGQGREASGLCGNDSGGKWVVGLWVTEAQSAGSSGRQRGRPQNCPHQRPGSLGCLSACFVSHG